METEDLQLTMWTLDEALPVVRAIEKAMGPLNYHVALAGGVLMRGHSMDDLDIIIYPRFNTKREPRTSVLAALVTLGFEIEYDQNEREMEYGALPDQKSENDLLKTTYQGKCVDFFLMLIEKPKPEEPCLISPPTFEVEEPPI